MINYLSDKIMNNNNNINRNMSIILDDFINDNNKTITKMNKYNIQPNRCERLYFELDDVQRLYDAGMVWLSGRHYDIHDDLNISYEEWRRKAYDHASVVMAVGLWIADDLKTNNDYDIPWAFYYTTKIAHPIPLMFGYKQGYD